MRHLSIVVCAKHLQLLSEKGFTVLDCTTLTRGLSNIAKRITQHCQEDCTTLTRGLHDIDKRITQHRQGDYSTSTRGYHWPTFVGRLSHVRGMIGPRSWDDWPTFVGQVKALGEIVAFPRRGTIITKAKKLMTHPLRSSISCDT